MSVSHYKVFDHTADLGIVFFGKTQPDLFSNAALSLFDLLVEGADTRPAASTEPRKLVIDGGDKTELFINFLREILYLFNSEGFVLTSCRIIRIDDKHLTAEIRGGCHDVRKHRIRTEIKAVTYHQATVMKTAKGWEGRVVFDV